MFEQADAKAKASDNLRQRANRPTPKANTRNCREAEGETPEEYC